MENKRNNLKKKDISKNIYLKFGITTSYAEKILDDTIEFGSSIPAGGSALEFMDYFLIQAYEGSELGDIPCVIHLRAGLQDPYYEVELSIDLSLSLDQYGFSYPSSTMNLKSSPVIGDLNGDSNYEIFVGDEDGRLYGFSHQGDALVNFPFEVTDKIRSSPAIGDVDNDGLDEVVFGSHDRKLYILNYSGQQELAYNQAGYIVGSPALYNLDDDTAVTVTISSSDTGEATVRMEEVFSFDRNHAMCRVDTNPERFVMPTYAMGDVTIEANQFFMAMHATSIDKYELITTPDGSTKVRMEGGLDCITEVGQANVKFGDRNVSEHATYTIEAVDNGVGGGKAGDTFAFTAYFDERESPLNYKIFGPSFTFTGEMIKDIIVLK